MDRDQHVLKVRHTIAVPGVGVFIAPAGIARLFTLTDYRKCPKFLPARAPAQPSLFDAIKEEPPVLYPLLLPNVLKSPRFYLVTTRARARKAKYGCR